MRRASDADINEPKCTRACHPCNALWGPCLNKMVETFLRRIAEAFLGNTVATEMNTISRVLNSP
eukprot:1779823-Amphidinium_carterae.1